MPDLSVLLVLVPVAAIAGFVRGFAGFGGPLLMLPILSFFFPPAASVVLMMLIDISVNLKLVPEVRNDASRAVILPLFVGTLIAMPLGVMALVYIDPLTMKRALNGSILAVALLMLAGWRYKEAMGTRSWFAAGLLTGLVMGATSIAVTAALFLNGGSLSAKEARANFIVWVFLAALVLLAMVLYSTPLTAGLLTVIAVLAPLYFIGTMLGSHMTKTVPEAVVRRGVLGLVVVVATAGLVV